MQKYNTIVFILRGQPVHKAHIAIIHKASKIALRVIVIIGSAHQPRTYKNPFSANERGLMISESTRHLDNINIEYNVDSIYNDQSWMIRVQQIVDGYRNPSYLHDNKKEKIGIIGHEKDHSSWYIKAFPQWDIIRVDDIVEELDATSIRDVYFREDFGPDNTYIKSVVTPEVYTFLLDFAETEDYQQIIKERKYVADYKKQYEHLQYSPVFVTSDAIVVQSGHVLMIKRKSEPGKGLWALPGGFLNADTDKSVLDCAIRELKEETKIKVPVPVLKGCVVESKVFDVISRSTRGRTITHAFYIILSDGELPKIKGSDDALVAEWIPIGQLDRSLCFEDHFEIIEHFIGG